MPEENLYQRGETWWLRAEIGGVKYRESLRTGDVKRARKLRDQRLDAIKADVHHGEARRSWHEAVTAWIRHTKGTISSNTLKRYAVSLKQVESLLAAHSISSIDGKAIGSLMEARRASGATHATLNRDLTAVSAVLTFAEAMGWREGNPTLSKRRLNRERRDPIYLPDEKSIIMLQDACTPDFRPMMVLARETGLRQAELAGMKWADLGVDGTTLSVIGKGNKRRVIRLSPDAQRTIRDRPKRSEYIISRFTIDGSGPPFTKPSQDFSHFRHKVERSRINGPHFKRFRFHDLRHLFAVEALRGGMGIYALSKHMGHSSVTVTEIYLSFLTGDEENQARAA